jgi:hypothetical protein
MIDEHALSAGWHFLHDGGCGEPRQIKFADLVAASEEMRVTAKLVKGIGNCHTVLEAESPNCHMMEGQSVPC